MFAICIIKPIRPLPWPCWDLSLRQRPPVDETLILCALYPGNYLSVVKNPQYPSYDLNEIDGRTGATMPEIEYADVRVPVSEHTAALYEWQRLDLIKHPSNRNPPRWWFSFRIGAYRKTGTHSGGSALDERVSQGLSFLSPPLCTAGPADGT